MTTAVPTVSALPTPPNPDDRDTFNGLAYPWTLALGDFTTQVNALGVNVKGNADEAATSASTATTKAAEAEASATAAGALAGAVQWVSGTTYAAGAAVWSPISFQTYRRKTAGAGTIDPSLDSTNWSPNSGVPLDASVTTDKVADGAITAAKLADGVGGGMTLLATLTNTTGNLSSMQATNLASSKKFELVLTGPNGYMQLNGAGVIQVSLSANNGTTWSAPGSASPSFNAQDGSISIFSTDTTAPRKNIVGMLANQVTSSSASLSGAVNAIKVSVFGSTIAINSVIYIYGSN